MKQRLGKQPISTGAVVPLHSVTSLEPFVEPLSADGHDAAPAGYRFGYRNAATGEAVCAIDVPAETVAQAVMSQLSLSVTMTADGAIAPLFVEPDGSVAAVGVAGIARPIDDIVGQATSPDGLALEHAPATDLKCLLARLERSLALAKAALARVGQEQNSRGD